MGRERTNEMMYDGISFQTKRALMELDRTEKPTQNISNTSYYTRGKGEKIPEMERMSKERKPSVPKEEAIRRHYEKYGK